MSKTKFPSPLCNKQMLLYFKNKLCILGFFLIYRSSLWPRGYFRSVRDIYYLSVRDKRDPEEEGTKFLPNVGK